MECEQWSQMLISYQVFLGRFYCNLVFWCQGSHIKNVLIGSWLFIELQINPHLICGYQYNCRMVSRSVFRREYTPITPWIVTMKSMLWLQVIQTVAYYYFYSFISQCYMILRAPKGFGEVLIHYSRHKEEINTENFSKISTCETEEWRESLNMKIWCEDCKLKFEDSYVNFGRS